MNSVTPILEPTGRPPDQDRCVIKNPEVAEKERDQARRLYEDSFNTAIGYLARARAVHHELETYYIPNMRFEEIDNQAQAVLEKIMTYARA